MQAGLKAGGDCGRETTWDGSDSLIERMRRDLVAVRGWKKGKKERRTEGVGEVRRVWVLTIKGGGETRE